MKRTVLLITVISLCTKLIGFLRELLLAYYFGAGKTVDAYLMAITIPSIFFGGLTALSVGFTPIYTGIRIKKGEKIADNYTNSLITISLLSSLFCVGIGLSLNRQLVMISGYGFDEDTRLLTEHFLKITIWMVILSTPIQIMISYLNCKQHFISASLTTMVLSSIQSIFVIIGGVFNNIFLPAGIVISYLIQLVLVSFFCKKSGLNYSLRITEKEKLEETVISVIPIFISTLVADINAFVDKMLASFLTEGSIAALNYAFTLRAFLHLVFSSSITAILYPKLSEYVACDEKEKLEQLLVKGLTYVLLLFIPLTVGAVILSKPVVSLVFMRGAFDEIALTKTTFAFIFYVISLAAVVMNDVLTKVFYSFKEGRVNTYLGLTSVLFNIVLNLILIKPMGSSGLAFATSISAMIVTPLYLKAVKKRMVNIKYCLLKDILNKILIATIGMGVSVLVVISVMGFFDVENKLQLILGILFITGTGVSVYCLILSYLKVTEIKELIGIIIRRKGDGK